MQVTLNQGLIQTLLTRSVGKLEKFGKILKNWQNFEKIGKMFLKKLAKYSSFNFQGQVTRPKKSLDQTLDQFNVNQSIPKSQPSFDSNPNQN